jgi:hypothetical protein
MPAPSQQHADTAPFERNAFTPRLLDALKARFNAWLRPPPPPSHQLPTWAGAVVHGSSGLRHTCMGRIHKHIQLVLRHGRELNAAEAGALLILVRNLPRLHSTTQGAVFKLLGPKCVRAMSRLHRRALVAILIDLTASLHGQTLLLNVVGTLRLLGSLQENAQRAVAPALPVSQALTGSELSGMRQCGGTFADRSRSSSMLAGRKTATDHDDEHRTSLPMGHRRHRQDRLRLFSPGGIHLGGGTGSRLFA